MPDQWGSWSAFDGVIVFAILVVLVIVAVDEWLTNRERERAYEARMRRVMKR